MSSNPDGRNGKAKSRRGRHRSAAGPLVDADTFRAEFDEDLADVLDLDSWRAGCDPTVEYRRIEREVRLAVASETNLQKQIRELVYPELARSEPDVPGAGHYRVEPEEVVATLHGLLFNGAVEACDGSTHDHRTLALGIHQVGVSLVSYRGERDSWNLRLFRRDLRNRQRNPVETILEVLEKRDERGGLHLDSQDALSELAQRGLMSYAERAILATRSRARWRMGHGSPAPLELIGARFTDLAIESIKVIRQLIDHGRFVFVSSEPSDAVALAFGQGLHPLEYLIIGTLRERIHSYLEGWAPTHAATVSTAWNGVPLPPEEWVRQFRDEVAPKVVYGVFRATALGPPQLFYAHADHAAVAARIAIADSTLLEDRGFPMLIDLADRSCKASYAGGSLRELADTAYAEAGAPFRYGSERATRPE